VLKLTPLNLINDWIEYLIIPVCEDKSIHNNRIISALTKKAMKNPEFKGKKDDQLVLFSPARLRVGQVIFMGLGKAADLKPETLRGFAGKILRQSVKKDRKEVTLTVPSERKTGIKMSDLLEAMLEGAYLGNHVFDQYKKEKEHKPVKKIQFLVKPQAAQNHSSLPGRVMNICAGTLLAREWVSLPSNHKRPEQYAQILTDHAKAAGLKVSVKDEKWLKKNKFNALLAVAQGSEASPRLVVLEYNTKKADRTIALIGKGVTFDAGGLNLKISGGMEGMKMDMAGSAAAAAAIISLSRLKPRFNVAAVIPIVENMPSGTATRPGDIVKTLEGKTVEIGNTDAEGRLILIDAITYTIQTYKPQTLIDLATLTGACVVALGEKMAGVFSNDDKLAGAIVASGQKTHERCWHMPLPDDYKEFLKSDFADISNLSSSKWGGAITAALFLSEFIKDTRWAHIDIAGPAYAKKESDYCGPGGTGFGVRLLCDLMNTI
jgi:leucyl aminopeptidase